MSIIITLALKDLKLFTRDRLAVFWAVAFPLLFALFFGSVFGGGGGPRGVMPIVVIDDANTDASRAFVKRLGESDSLAVDTVESAQEADNLVRRGKRVAYLKLTPEFSDSVFALFGGAQQDSASIELGVDPARSAERGMLVGLVTQTLFSGMTEQFTDPQQMMAQVTSMKATLDDAEDLNPAQKKSLDQLFDALGEFSESADASGMNDSAQQPTQSLTSGLVATKEVGRDRKGTPRSPFQITFASAIVWGLVGCATTFAASLVRERTMGTMLRLRTAPLRQWQVLGGKGLACFTAGLTISCLLLTVGVAGLGVQVGSPGLLLVALPCAAACFTGIMMVMSVIGKTEAAVAGGSWVIVMPMAMLGGGMIPLVSMPSWMLTASNISPFKYAILAIEGAIWRDLTLAELALPVTILLGLALGLYALGVVLFRRQH